MVKLIVFDLDDTLYDNWPRTQSAIKQTIDAMIQAGLNCSSKEGIKKFTEIISEQNRIKTLVETFGPNDKEIEKIGHHTYRNANFKDIILYPGVKETLEKLRKKHLLILLTYGSIPQQKEKIEILKITPFFDDIFITDVDKKEIQLGEICNKYEVDPIQVLVVGDSIKSEIRAANSLNMLTVRLLKGKKRDLVPENDLEQADYEIHKIPELFDIIKKLDNKEIKVVTIGGGTGTSSLLEGLKHYTDHITAVVNVTDSGRSSGKLRKDLNILAPGDTRNCLISLAKSEKLMCDLFQYRFDKGDLEGYSVGNLLIVALIKLTGSFEKAVEQASKILQLKGQVCPVTFDNIHICAELEDGTILNEEDKIIDRNNPKVYERSPIKRVFHSPTGRVNQKAVKAIEEADIIVFSPGSLFTSIISNILVQGIPEAIIKSKAKKVYVCNMMTQQCQTSGYKASDHLKQLTSYLGQTPDYIIVNTKKPKQELIDMYQQEYAELVEIDVDLQQLDCKVIEADLIDEAAEQKILWEKKDLLRHDPDKTAQAIMRLVDD